MGLNHGKQIVPLEIQKRSFNEQNLQLFDFAQAKLRTKMEKFTIYDSGYLENNQGVMIYNSNVEPSLNSVMHIDFINPSQVSLECISQKKYPHKVWIKTSINPTLIDVGDQIKLGRYELRITKIQLQQGVLMKSFAFRPSFIEDNLIFDNSRIPQCRLCFMQGSEDNQLISPCLCSGSQQFIHFKCLRDWIKTKITVVQQEFCQTITSPALICEVCGAFFKKQYQFDGQIIPLLKYKTPKSPYIVLEGSKTNDINCVIIVLKLTPNKQISIGRQTSNDVRLDDISISRNHCVFSLLQQKLYISDRKSKFGTLYRPKKVTKLMESISLLFNNSLLQIKQSPGFVKSCCNAQVLAFNFLS